MESWEVGSVTMPTSQMEEVRLWEVGSCLGGERSRFESRQWDSDVYVLRVPVLPPCHLGRERRG